MENISIEVGPYHGQFGHCASDNNSLASGVLGTFSCTTIAKGSAMTIALLGNRTQYLTLCEVFAYGDGNILTVL